ncbi:MAG: ATP-binding cassette domain-containing protein [Pseudonocardiaceae bacterium]
MRFKSVSFRYARRGVTVLDGIGLELESGTITAVVGGNGCGKSSLLKVAAGLLRPTLGSVQDRPSKIGYVPERLPANMRLSSHSYLLHMGRIQGLGTPIAARRAGDLMDRLRIQGDTEAPIGTLSKGNAQKVALAQAMLADPQLLVLDEPWSGLDAPTHRTLMECLADLRTAGVIILLTEHRPGTVSASADTVYRLDHGRLTEEHPHPARPDEFSLTLGVPAAAGADQRAAAQMLRNQPGVRSANISRSRIRLHTTAEHRDAVLLTALHQGYTVLEVHPVSDVGTPTKLGTAATEQPGEPR